jgi:hypothetical protein
MEFKPLVVLSLAIVPSLSYTKCLPDTSFTLLNMVLPNGVLSLLIKSFHLT